MRKLVSISEDDVQRLEELADAAYRHLTPGQHGIDGAHVATIESVVSQLKLDPVGIRFTDVDSVDVVLANGDELKGYRTNMDGRWHFVWTKQTAFSQELLDELHAAIAREEARSGG